MTTVIFLRRTLFILLLLGLTACSGKLTPAAPSVAIASPVATLSPAPSATPTPTSSPTTLPSATPWPTATLSPSATPAPTLRATPSPTATQRPWNLTNPQVVVLAQNLPGPDDLLLASDGSIYMSDVGDGTVKRYTTDGRVQVILTDLREPEGIIVLPDGSLVIAEQVPNRLLHYDPALKVLTPLLNLENTTNLEGVDGISLDARARDKLSIVIADSRNGRVLRASLDGKTVTELGRGFVRPTAVWIEADGSILVVDEEGNTLKRIRPDGKIEKLADLPVPDDVIEDDAGHIFVNTLRDNAIHMISAATNQDSILVRGLALPQGIIFDADGNLVVSDPGHHRLIKIVIRP